MNGNQFDERLSAWLDDELSLDERAEVERLLAEEPEARIAASELEKASSLLRDLPQVPAPVELHASVMRAIERDMLLSGRDIARSRGIRVRRLVAAAAVVLTVGVIAWNWNGNRQPVAVHQPEIGHFSSPDGKSAANRPESNTAVQKDNADANTGSLSISREQLDQARIGDVIEAVERSGAKVSVIRLTVVDRKAGAEALQLLLARERIPVNGSLSDGTVAVSIEPKPEELQKALREMRQQFDFDLLSVDSSTELAAEPSELKTLTDPSAPASDGRKRVVFVLVNAPRSSDASRPGSGA